MTSETQGALVGLIGILLIGVVLFTVPHKYRAPHSHDGGITFHSHN